MSFAFIPNAVKKKKPILVSSHAPSASISVGAQVTSESVDNSKGTKVFLLAFILLNDILTFLFLTGSSQLRIGQE